MFSSQSLHKDEKGQAALETAIILIAFVVVASVFAFAILSAGSASTDKGKQAINAGLEGVQSSMAVKGAVSADAASSTVDHVVVDLSLAAGGDPVDLTPPGSSHKNVVVVTYRDSQQVSADISWDVKFIGANSNTGTATILHAAETAEMTIDLTGLTTKLGPNTQFTIEIKPPTGAVLKISRTTPASIDKVMELN